jgi:hypothetical protein
LSVQNTGQDEKDQQESARESAFAIARADGHRENSAGDVRPETPVAAMGGIKSNAPIVRPLGKIWDRPEAE